MAAFDSFDDRYLGPKTSDPTLDNDGNALVAGALYFNSAAGEMRVYTGSVWAAAYVSGSGVLLQANNLSDVADATTARGNISAAKSGSNSDITSLNGVTDGISTPDYVQFSTTGATGNVARLLWNDSDGTLEFGLKGGNVTLQVGQEQVLRATNATGATLVDGTVVYITGSTGSHVNIVKAQANAETTSSKTIGVVTEHIADNQRGFVTTSGLVHDLDTSALTEGGAVWLSASTAGGMTSTRPSSPNHAVLIGWCVRSHASVGVIYVHVMNGYELEELHDVSFASKANNDVLSYDSANALWKNRALATVANTGAYSDLSGKPTNVSSFTNDSGYLTSFTEADPTVGSHIKAITTTNISNWNTAYGWGNHASAGYLLSSTAASTYQPLDGDLTAIAGIAATSGLLKKTAADTWSLDTSSYLTGNQSISISGDASGSGSTSITLTLATVNSNVGTFNNVTVNAKGLVTAASNVSYQPLDADLTAIAGIAATSGLLKKTAADTWSLDTSTYLTSNQSITLSGDASGSGTTAITVTLANSGVTAGTYNSVTVNAKGLVTGGSVKPAPNVQSVTSAATVTPNADTNDLVSISAQAVGLTIAAPTGTATDGEKLLIRIKDGGTTQTISWNAVYVAGGAALPTATTAGKWHHIGLIYNSNTSTWMCVAATVQA